MFSPGIYDFILYYLKKNSFGNSSLNTDLIFLANINSADDNPELVLGFGVTRYTLDIVNGFVSVWFLLMLAWKCPQIILPVH